jgi:uncharacterized membrane protein required for colicin V production
LFAVFLIGVATQMNLLDLIVFIVLALAAFFGYRKGLIRTVYRLASFVIAWFLASRLYEPMAGFLRQTPVYPWLKNGISNTLNLEGAFADHAQGMALPAGDFGTLIEGLPLPASLQDMLQGRAAPDISGMLNMEAVEEGIAGVFAGIAINAVAMLAVFLLVMLVLGIGGMALDIVGRLPVINTLNRAGGFAFGLALGLVIIWLGLAVMSMLLAANPQGEIYDLLSGSAAARLLLSNGWMPPGISVGL